MSSVSVVMASMNEEEGIRECLDKIFKVFDKHQIDGEVVVADNSTDRTPQIAREFGARVVTPDKLGYGYAIVYGIDQAQGEFIVMGDGDGTYDFNDIPNLIIPLIKGEANLVIGSRFGGKMQKGAMPWLHRYIGNPLLTWCLNLKLGTRVSDAHSGLRSFTKAAWDEMNKEWIPEDFCSEMLKQMAKNKARISEIPVNYYVRRGKTKAGTLLHGWRCFKFLILRIILSK
ncbi:putative glycosyltransferase [subsurface metagenome]